MLPQKKRQTIRFTIKHRNVAAQQIFSKSFKRWQVMYYFVDLDRC